MKRILVALAVVASVIGSAAGVVAVATSLYSAPALADGCQGDDCK